MILLGAVVNGAAIAGGGLVGLFAGKFLPDRLQKTQMCAWAQWVIRIAGQGIVGTMGFAVGAMAIMGALNSGLQGDHTILFSKSVIDGISALIFASTLGVGVVCSAVPVFLWEALIALLASLLAPVLGADVIAEINSIGSLLLLAISLNMLGLTKIRLMNMVPAMLFPILLCRFL